MQNRLFAAAVLGACLVTIGCAGIRRTADEALEAARAAQTAADTAQLQAAEAQRSAAGAQGTANQALAAAQEAQACCDATNQRLDRMFEQAQRK